MEETAGEILRRYRRSVGKTQYQAADEMGVTREMVRRWEINERQPNVNSLRKIAAFTGYSLDELAGKEVTK